MKKDISILIAIILLVVGMIYTDYCQHTYTLEYCKVIEVIGDTVVAKDFYGNTWAYKEQGDKVGNIVHLHMYDNRTANDYDDVIKHVEVVVAEGL